MKSNLFKAAMFTPARCGRWGLELLAWGTPGIAKSAVLREECARYGLPLVELSPALLGEGAFGAIPVPDRSGVIKYPPPEWVQQVAEGGVVFIDELTCAPPALAPALLGLVLDARIGFHVLHPRVRRVAAANPPEYAANGYDLNPAQANRLGHVGWSAPSVEEHSAYMLRGSTGHAGNGHAEFSATAEEERVLAAWNDGAWARAVGLETAFLAARPDLKNQCPKAGDAAASGAWPSDRSWESATRALASAQCHGLSEADTDEFVAAFIGVPVAAEWKVFMKAADLPDAGQLLDGKVKFDHNPARLDRTCAVLNACVALVAPKEATRREQRVAAFWGVLDDLFTSARTSQDIVIGPALALTTAKLGATSEYREVRAAYGKIGSRKEFVSLLQLALRSGK